MTRDEMIEKVARALCLDAGEIPDQETPYNPNADFVWQFYKWSAVVVIDTIFAALKEPTRNMKTAWDDDMSDWINEVIEDPWHPWVVMLSASPLAPNNKENK